MEIFERQCTVCGLIYDLDYPEDARYFKCDSCDLASKKQKSRSQKLLKKNKEEKVMED